MWKSKNFWVPAPWKKVPALEECDSPMDEVASSVHEAPALQTGLCHAHWVLSPCAVTAGWHHCQKEHSPVLSFWGH